MNAAAIVAAAGDGLRMGGVTRKQYLLLEGEPLLARSLKLFVEHPAITEIIVVVPPDDTDVVFELLQPHCPLGKVKLIGGGATRQESVNRGLVALSAPVELVCIHDAARPLFSGALLDKLLEMAARWGAAVPVIPLSDTLKEVDSSGFILSTPPREALRQVQTPQVFRLSLLREACMNATLSGMSVTDDAALVELLGKPVMTVPGELSNLKITSPRDLILASLILKGAGLG